MRHLKTFTELVMSAAASTLAQCTRVELRIQIEDELRWSLDIALANVERANHWCMLGPSHSPARLDVVVGDDD